MNLNKISILLIVISLVLFESVPCLCTTPNVTIQSSSTTDSLLNSGQGHVNQYVSNIVLSEDAVDRRYDYAEISIQSQTSVIGNYTHQCGGTLIAIDMILTAAHCRNLVDRVLIDVHDLQLDLSANTTYRVLNVSFHPNYEAETFEYDFATVQISSNVNISLIAPVHLNNDSSVPNDGIDLIVLGYGTLYPPQRNKTNEYPSTIQMGTVQSMNNSKCGAFTIDGMQLYDGEIHDEMLCALGSGGVDACSGDSGGPLIIPGSSEEKDVQVGIVSWGRGCGVYPGVYSRVSSGYAWIRERVCYQSIDPPSYMGCKNYERNPRYTTINDTNVPSPPVSQSTTAPDIPSFFASKVPSTRNPVPIPSPILPLPTPSPKFDNSSDILELPSSPTFVSPQPTTIRRPSPITTTSQPSSDSGVKVDTAELPTGAIAGIDNNEFADTSSSSLSIGATGIRRTIQCLYVTIFGMIFFFVS